METRTPSEILSELDPNVWEDFGIIDEALWGFVVLFRSAGELGEMRPDSGSNVAALLELVVERFEAAVDRHGKIWQELTEALQVDTHLVG